MKSLLLLLLLTKAIWAQEHASLDSKKRVVAILPLDAVALATPQGATVTITIKDSTITKESSAPALFADRAAISAFAEAATQKIVNAILSVKRLRVMERTAMDKIIKEQNFQLGDLSKPNENVKIGELLGAQYMVMGQLQQVGVVQIREDSWGQPLATPTYSATVELNLRLVDVSTGEIINSKGFKGSTGFLYQNTPAEAAYKALNESEKDIAEALRRLFPAEGYILEIRKDKKGEATEVVITCGKDLGIRKEDVFKVYVETEIDVEGQMRKRTSDVGKLVVTKLEEDGSFARCEVDKGGKEIFKKFGAGVKLKVVQVKK